MNALMRADGVSKRFERPLSLGERLARRFRGTATASVVHAVDRASVEIQRSEVLGLVGESGCGKSTLGRMLAGILVPTEGRVTLDGRPVMTVGRSPRKCERRVQMVFQDPFASLNPRMKIGPAITEGPVAHGLVRRAEARAYASHWLQRV